MGGSCNWTNPTNLFNDYNNIIFIQDKSIAQTYTSEFNEMWGGIFGENKEDNTPHLFNVNGIEMEVYFSPSDGTTSKIGSFINDVDYTLEFALLSFTRNDLGLSIIAKDEEFGVNIRGILESQNATGSEYDNLINAGVNVRSHMGVPYSLHHKYAISDGNVAGSDPSVLTGSHNWSTNAESNSDENTIIIHDYTIANIYLQEFEERWNELTTSINALADVKINLFPNPSEGKVSVITESMIDVIHIYDIEGQFVQSTKSKDFEISSRGIYFIKITFNDGNYTLQKVVIQ
jgi:phosphatidylserine/phosphatidylglycerophosphate/cardiolipin synthase-like enzyme